MATTSTTYLPLTTTFTPAPECSYLTLTNCWEASSCEAVAHTDYPDKCNGHVPQCFPNFTTSMDTTIDYSYVEPYQTYSPGLYCPLHWITAASALSPDGVWCCPTGYSFVRDQQNCQATVTEGTAVTTVNTCDVFTTVPFGPMQTNQLSVSMDANETSLLAASDLTVSVWAGGIFLVGATWADDPSRTKTPIEVHYQRPTPTNTIIGASVGGTIGAILLLSFGAWLIVRYRRKRISKTKEEEAVSKPTGGNEDYPLYKPELHGRLARPTQFIKPELDANAARLELEGRANHTELDRNEVPVELETVIRAELEG